MRECLLIINLAVVDAFAGIQRTRGIFLSFCVPNNAALATKFLFLTLQKFEI